MTYPVLRTVRPPDGRQPLPRYLPCGPEVADSPGVYPAVMMAADVVAEPQPAKWTCVVGAADGPHPLAGSGVLQLDRAGHRRPR